MRGRKPVPVQLRVLRGNPGQRRLPAVRPAADGLPERCPPELVDEEARAEWRKTIAPLARRQHVLASDRAMAVSHCAVWAQWRSLVTEAERHPAIVPVGPHKYLRPHPARLLAERALRVLLAIDIELGLTPASRGRVTVAGPLSAAEQLDRFLDPSPRTGTANSRTSRQ